MIGLLEDGSKAGIIPHKPKVKLGDQGANVGSPL
jgi:hypothetical protein